MICRNIFVSLRIGGDNTSYTSLTCCIIYFNYAEKYKMNIALRSRHTPLYWEIDDRLIYGGITWLVNDLANEDDAG